MEDDIMATTSRDKEISKENQEMIERKSWDEFRNSGLLWFINTILHTFGWCITIEISDEDGSVVNVFPGRTKYRGFAEKSNSNGYLKLTQYIAKNAGDLLKEVQDLREE